MNENESPNLIPVEVSEHNLLALIDRIRQNSRGEPLTWGATPLVSSTEVKMQQDAVKSEINALFDQENIPNYVSAEIAVYIDDLNTARTFNRESHNQDSYAYREKMDVDGLPIEILEIITRATKGHASPAELLLIQKIMGVPSIELTSLTHPYGPPRIGMLKEMRPAVNEAITLMGGRLVKGIAPTFEVKGSDSHYDPSQMKGIHMTRKTIFGYLEDGTEIVERSSFVVLLDELQPEVAAAVREIPYDAQWAKLVGTACGLSKLASDLLAEDDYRKAIPVSTTVVAINAELETKLLSKEAMRARQRQFMAAHAINV